VYLPEIANMLAASLYYLFHFYRLLIAAASLAVIEM
jgi:hypothetical protein